MPDHRPRGYQPAWRPRPQTVELLAAVDVILARYAEQLPLSIRQVFYAAVSDGALPKTERGYKRLAEVLGMARRADRIAWEAIRDDSGTCLSPPPEFAGLEDFRTQMRQAAANFRLDRQEGQPARIEIFCESAGMAPMLTRIAHPFGIDVRSGGGFNSLPEKRNTALRAAAETRPLRLLHIGDLDPSGVWLPVALAEDVAAFAAAHGGRSELVRVAVTEEQVARYQLPSAPVKATDRRAFTAAGTTQAEALPPDVLLALVRGAIEERHDRAVFDAVLEREAAEREQLLRELGE
ncbi:hypothetical protein [Streptomyces sp. H39-C1]|uniref:hypothetical protein n=1 Tax=Streptomyces sp. H39-C1 TaxID=3004355 RepID=UPI0022B04B98|nr:hypothetical protein [Streptomyces sp. H39-C1]MCZ4102637.1 hypothetical protein [Streptomyces sp. H39-C1]